MVAFFFCCQNILQMLVVKNLKTSAGNTDFFHVSETFLFLTKEKTRLASEIKRCEGMLNNPKFVDKAPAEKVAAEREKLAGYREMAEKVESQLARLS